MLYNTSQIVSVLWKWPCFESSFKTRVGVRHTTEKENTYISEIQKLVLCISDPAKLNVT